MHNHPRNASFSSDDFNAFIEDDNLKTSIIIKNNGKMEALIKTNKYNKKQLLIDYRRNYKKYFKTGTDSEIDKIIQQTAKQNEEGVIWEIQ